MGLLARGRDGLEGARRDVEALGGRALALPTDVADPGQVEAAADAVETQLGPIDHRARDQSLHLWLVTHRRWLAAGAAALGAMVLLGRGAFGPGGR